MKTLFILHSRQLNNMSTAYIAESLSDLEKQVQEKTNNKITDFKSIQIVTNISKQNKGEEEK